MEKNYEKNYVRAERAQLDFEPLRRDGAKGFFIGQDLLDFAGSCFCFFPFPEEREKDNPPLAEVIHILT
ncbi:MAG: hypothetical protein Q7J15_08645 [Candidatus Desulfaltia sp.]|nr:hypothetical protein [Candidatus Desulfaltia sp.]